MTIHRDRQAKLAQEMGEKILGAMDALNRNPQSFTAGIGEWQLHGEIGYMTSTGTPAPENTIHWILTA